MLSTLHRVPAVGRAGRRPLPPRRPAGATRHRRGPRRRRAAARHPPRHDDGTPSARRRPWRSGSATPSAATPGFPPPDDLGRRHRRDRAPGGSTCRTRPSCAAARRPTPPAWSSSAPSIPAGIPAAPCTSTSWSHADGAALTSQLYFPDDDQRPRPRHGAVRRATGPRHHQRHRRDLPDRRRPGRARHRARRRRVPRRASASSLPDRASS